MVIIFNKFEYHTANQISICFWSLKSIVYKEESVIKYFRHRLPDQEIIFSQKLWIMKHKDSIPIARRLELQFKSVKIGHIEYMYTFRSGLKLILDTFFRVQKRDSSQRSDCEVSKTESIFTEKDWIRHHNCWE